MKAKLLAAFAVLIVIVGTTSVYAAPPANTGSYERPHTKDYRERTGRKQSVYDDERQASKARAKAATIQFRGSDSSLAVGPDGQLYSADYIDQLRGQHAGRTEEAHRFARRIMAMASERPYIEVNHGTGARTKYTGVVRIMRWQKKPGLIGRLFGKKTQEFYTAARQVHHDGRAICWQGPNPPIGYYSAKKYKYQYIGGPYGVSTPVLYATR